jgi:hypothetical protein
MGELDDAYWEAAWKDPTIYLLKRIYFHAVECLKEVGQDRFEILLKPIVLPSSMSASILARNALKLEGDDLVTNARLVSFGHDYLSYGTIDLQLFEKAVVKRTDRCLLQDGPPEACFHCRLAGPLECSSTNPQHEMIVRSCMTEGFRICEWYIKKVDQTIHDQKDLGKKLMNLPTLPLSKDQRLQLSREILAYYIHFTLMAIVENFGIDELLNRMRHRMYMEGMRYYYKNTNIMDSKTEDRLQLVLMNLINTLDLKADLNHKGETKEIVIESCPFSSFPAYYCQIIEFFYKGLCLQDGRSREFVQLDRMTECKSCCRYLLRDISPEELKWSDIEKNDR